MSTIPVLKFFILLNYFIEVCFVSRYDHVYLAV